jgi:cell wall assembly regulator SMI1
MSFSLARAPIARQSIAHRQVYTWNDEHDHAIELLHKLVAMPGYINYARLKFHPLWRPLRGDPRFDKIVASLAPKER